MRCDHEQNHEFPSKQSDGREIFAGRWENIAGCYRRVCPFFDVICPLFFWRKGTPGLKPLKNAIFKSKKFLFFMEKQGFGIILALNSTLASVLLMLVHTRLQPAINGTNQ